MHRLFLSTRVVQKRSCCCLHAYKSSTLFAAAKACRNSNNTNINNNNVTSSASTLRNYSTELERLVGKDLAAKESVVAAASQLKQAYQLFQERQFTPCRLAFEQAIASLEQDLLSNSNSNAPSAAPSPLLAVAYNNAAETMRNIYSSQTQDEAKLLLEASNGNSAASPFKYSFKDILPLFKKSEAVWNQIKDAEVRRSYANEEATLYNNMGLYYMDCQALHDAIPSFEKSEKMRRILVATQEAKINSIVTEAKSQQVTEKTETIEGLTAAIAHLESFKGDLAATLSNMAQCLQRQNKIKQALKMYLDAQAVYPLHMSTASELLSLNNNNNNNNEEKNNQPSQQAQQEHQANGSATTTATTTTAATPNYSYFYIILLNSIGMCNLNLGKTSESLKNFEDALDAMDKRQKQRNIAPREEFGITCLNIGTVHFGKNRFEEAESFFRQALNNFDKFLPPFNKTTGSCCTQLAMCLRKIHTDMVRNGGADAKRAAQVKEESDKLIARASAIAQNFKDQQQQIQQPEKKRSMFSTLLKVQQASKKE